MLVEDLERPTLFSLPVEVPKLLLTILVHHLSDKEKTAQLLISLFNKLNQREVSPLPTMILLNLVIKSFKLHWITLEKSIFSLIMPVFWEMFPSKKWKILIGNLLTKSTFSVLINVQELLGRLWENKNSEESLTPLQQQDCSVTSVKLITQLLSWPFTASLKLLPNKDKRITFMLTLLLHWLLQEC